MTRTMGDAIRINAAQLPKTLDLVAGYGTGSPDIRWTDATYATFPGAVHVVIDQGYTGAPLYSAHVIDIETGAWEVTHVTGWMNNATAPRPTLYVNRGNEWAACLAALHSPRFKGDVWLSFPGWATGEALPALPAGCHYVAVQNQLGVSNSYDLSEVFDDNWPAKGPDMNTVIRYANGEWYTFTEYADTKDVRHVYGIGVDHDVWQSVSADGGVTWTVTKVSK